MNRFITILSCAFAVSSFAYMFRNDSIFGLKLGLLALVLLIVAYRIEYLLKTNGNAFVNRFVYFFTKSDKRYNYKSRYFVYSRISDKEYSFEKTYDIYPTCSDLDSISDRFSWSAPSTGSKIISSEKTHEISNTWQQDMWTCFTIYFRECCTKHEIYKTGSIITDLFDEKIVAVPYLSATIDRKTEQIILVAKIPRSMNPTNACLKVYSAKNTVNEVYSLPLEYDDSVGGFKVIVKYPRKGWKYVITWQY